jgi:hypothetical protein
MKKKLTKRPVGRPPTGINEMIAIRWSPTLIGAIDLYAKQRGLNRGQALRQIVSEYMVKYLSQPKKKPTKCATIRAMLLRPEGTTVAQVLKVTGWLAVSMPAQAKAADLYLTKERTNGETIYRGYELPYVLPQGWAS